MGGGHHSTAVSDDSGGGGGGVDSNNERGGLAVGSSSAGSSGNAALASSLVSQRGRKINKPHNYEPSSNAWEPDHQSSDFARQAWRDSLNTKNLNFDDDLDDRRVKNAQRSIRGSLRCIGYSALALIDASGGSTPAVPSRLAVLWYNPNPRLT